MTTYTFTTTTEDDEVLDFWARRASKSQQTMLTEVMAAFIASRRAQMHSHLGSEMETKFRSLGIADKTIVSQKLGLDDERT